MRIRRVICKYSRESIRIPKGFFLYKGGGQLRLQNLALLSLYETLVQYLHNVSVLWRTYKRADYFEVQKMILFHRPKVEETSSLQPQNMYIIHNHIALLVQNVNLCTYMLSLRRTTYVY
jgi:hypothetical protein